MTANRNADLVLGAAVLAMGLLAGLFYAFDVAVMPALTAADDRSLVDTMQQMIDKIENPAFFLTFLGAPVLAGIALSQARRSGSSRTAGWIIAALVLYALMVVVTVAVHFPLNEDMKQAGDPSRIGDLAAVRDDFLTPWVVANVVRTLATTAAFGCLVWALVLRGRHISATPRVSRGIGKETRKESEMDRIAVTGATGRVGRHVAEIAEKRGHDVVRASRSTGVDVTTGEGLAEALAGVDTIIDVATGPSPDEQAATEFFTAATHNLQQAGADAGVGRLVVVSIVGCDRFSGGYNKAKVVQEQLVLGGPIPARILRATQFHEFVEEMMGWSTQGDVAYLPRMRTQLVAARTVADALVDLATASEHDSTSIPEIGGPREEDLVEAASLLAARRGDGLRVEAASDPSNPDVVAWESGASLPGPGATLAGPTFAEWVEAMVPARA